MGGGGVRRHAGVAAEVSASSGIRSPTGSRGWRAGEKSEEKRTRSSGRSAAATSGCGVHPIGVSHVRTLLLLVLWAFAAAASGQPACPSRLFVSGFFSTVHVYDAC